MDFSQKISAFKNVIFGTKSEKREQPAEANNASFEPTTSSDNQARHSQVYTSPQSSKSLEFTGNIVNSNITKHGSENVVSSDAEVVLRRYENVDATDFYRFMNKETKSADTFESSDGVVPKRYETVAASDWHRFMNPGPETAEFKCHVVQEHAVLSQPAIPPSRITGVEVDRRIRSEPTNLSVSLESAGNSLLVTITPPAIVSTTDNRKAHNLSRAPLDLVTVVDVSASMATSAPAFSEPGKSKEDTGLSVLDIVKHAMKAIIATMEDGDRLAVVTFDRTAEVISDFVSTDELGKKKLNDAVESMHTRTMTNLWDGLKMGMNLLDNLQNSSSRNFNTNRESRLSSVFILTDGQPNIIPPRGHIPMLEKYLASHPSLRLNISTFGFGYDLDSTLLSDIAKVGAGGFGFIPDAGMVGTVFIHAVSNVYATYATRSFLDVEIPEQGARLEQPKGGFPCTQTDRGARVDFGDLQYGQTRDLVLEFIRKNGGGGIPEGTVIKAVVEPWYAATTIATSRTVNNQPNSAIGQSHLYNIHRLRLVDNIYLVCDKLETSLSWQNYATDDSSAVLLDAKKIFIKQARDISSDSTLSSYELAKALSKDINGEVALAVTEVTNWKKWGRHYFLSLARSHQRQQCGNFKDASLQIYGKHSTLFKISRDLMDDAFDNLPPPMPSKQITSYQMPSYHPMANMGDPRRQFVPSFQSSVQVQPLNMRNYNLSDAPCFTGSNMVSLANSMRVRADEIVRGSVVATPAGPRKVEAVLKTEIVNGPVVVCKIGTLIVTPWHPIFFAGKWCFPASLSEPELESHDAIYSFLLQRDDNMDSHAIEIEGVRAVTMGHGLEGRITDMDNITGDGDARKHPFFGSYEEVIAQLKKLDGFDAANGIVRCSRVQRNGGDLVTGFIRDE